MKTRRRVSWHDALRTGDRVLARWSGDGKRYYGRIHQKRRDGRMEVAWEDGDPIEVVDRVYPPTDEEEEELASSDDEWEDSNDESEETGGDDQTEETRGNDEPEESTAPSAGEDDDLAHLPPVLRELATSVVSLGYNKSLKFYYRAQPKRFIDVYRTDAFCLEWVRGKDNLIGKRYMHFHKSMDAHLGVSA